MRKIGKFHLIILAFIVSLSLYNNMSCVKRNSLNTTSGKPEVFIEKVSKKYLRNIIINKMLSRGFILKKDSENILTFSKFEEDISRVAAIKTLLGSSSLTPPEVRYIFNLIEHNNGVRIVVSIFYIVPPHIFDFSKKREVAYKMQEFLINLKKELQCHPANC